MDVSGVVLSEHWDNLIFTNDDPGNPDETNWALRGHRKQEKTRGWFQMVILSSGCATKAEAIEKAKPFTVEYVFTDKIMAQ